MIDQWTTKRLIATRLSRAHFREICQLHSDRSVMRTLSADGAPLPDDETRARLDKAEDHWRQHGFGLWAIHRRDTHEFIGRAGIQRYVLENLNGRQEIGLAYAVISAAWGQGYATEMARGVLATAFGVLAFPQVATWTLPDNLASQRVMAKLGFRYERDFVFADLHHRLYCLERHRYLNLPAPTS